VQHFRVVFGGQRAGFGDESGLRGLVEIGRRRRARGKGDADLREKLFLTGS